MSKSIQKKSIRLTPKNVETVLFFKCNLRALSNLTSLCVASEGFIAPNFNYYND